jgi:hypothetical protein
MASYNASSSGLGDDPNNYDWTQSESEGEEDDVMIVEAGYGAEVSGTSQALQQSQATTTSTSTPTRRPPRRRPEPTEGYIYGFILPFTVSDSEYCVVKIGQTRADQIGRRLREHNNEFIRATRIPIFTESVSRATPDEVNDLVKWREQAKVFLLSYVQGNLRAAESGARACIGVAPFNTEPIFRRVFPNSEKVTITEWVVAKKKVVEDIQVAFWHNQLDRFDTVDVFLDKLKELNRRRHIDLTISLESINLELYRDQVRVPQFVKLLRDSI